MNSPISWVDIPLIWCPDADPDNWGYCHNAENCDYHHEDDDRDIRYQLFTADGSPGEPWTSLGDAKEDMLEFHQDCPLQPGECIVDLATGATMQALEFIRRFC